MELSAKSHHRTRLKRLVLTNCLILLTGLSLASSASAQQRRRFAPPRQVPRPTKPVPRNVPANQPNEQIRLPLTTAQLPATQPAPPATPGPTKVADTVVAAAENLSLAEIEKREQAAKELPDLEEDVRTRLNDQFVGAKANLEKTASFREREARLQKLLNTVTDRAEELRKLALRLEETRTQPPSETTIPLLSERLAREQEELRLLRDRKLQLDEQATKRAASQQEIRKRLAAIEVEIAEAKVDASAVPVSGEVADLSAAKRLLAQSRLQKLLSERPALQVELELFSAEASEDLLQLERSVNAQHLKLWNEQVQITSSALQSAREKAAGTAVEEAVRDERVVPAALQPIAEASLLIAEENQSLTLKIQAAEKKLVETEAKLDRLKQQFATIQAKVNSVGLVASVGAMLRGQRKMMPSATTLRASARARQQKEGEAQLRIFDLDDEMTRLVDLEAATQRELSLLSADAGTVLSQQDRAAAKQLLENRRVVVGELYRSQQSYFETLTSISIIEEQLARLAEEFRNYIEERVLWIRSHPALHESLRQADWGAELALVQKTSGLPLVANELVRDGKLRPITYFFGAMTAGLLMLLQLGLNAPLRRIAARARGSAYSHFTPSLMALVFNGIACLFWPFVLTFLGWRLLEVSTVGELGAALGHGCWAAGIVMLPISFFQQVFAKDGLADAHFDWTQTTTKLLRRNIRWILVTLLPLVLVGATVLHLQGTTGAGLIPRFLFLLACLTIGVFQWRVMHPTSGLPSRYLSLHQGGWVERLQVVWFWGLMAIPMALAVLVVCGYSYTATELAWRGFQTVVIIGLLWVLHALFMRLILVHRRKLSMERARERYAAFQQKEQEEAAAPSEEGASQTADEMLTASKRVIADLPGVRVTAGGIVVEEDPLADLRANTAQSRRLTTTLVVGAGIVLVWLTWHNVLPALGFLENWPLWNSSREIVETVMSEDGLEEKSIREVIDPVTIADLVLALFVAAVGFVAARDLPGLLELAILKRLPLENSIRYAITTLSKYGLVFVGLFVACRLVGLRWQQIQWMATALTFGLAFGLQEMFANFVAGIIILFERPVRVGDIVTIDEVTGVISKIRMRATTMTNWDRKDYIVPNRDFITGRLLNWTRSDQVSRIVIPIGVAYGSDTELAKKLLVEIASQHPLVETEPPPMATFDEFGDSALAIVLRCFIAMENMPMRLEMIDQLNSAIDLAYRDAGIEIAFPQQDIHLRVVPEEFLGKRKSP